MSLYATCILVVCFGLIFLQNQWENWAFLAKPDSKKEYYEVLNNADKFGDSTQFVEFMLIPTKNIDWQMDNEVMEKIRPQITIKKQRFFRKAAGYFLRKHI